jgi:hypothetical protein
MPHHSPDVEILRGTALSNVIESMLAPTLPRTCQDAVHMYEMPKYWVLVQGLFIVVNKRHLNNTFFLSQLI